MKKYENPEFEIIELVEDVVTYSPCLSDANPIGDVDFSTGAPGCN